MPLLISYQSPDDFKVLNVTAFVGNFLNLGSPGSTLTLTANTISVTRSWHNVSAAGTTAQRSLRTINGGSVGDILVLQKDAASVGDVIIDDNAGNIQSAGNFTLTNTKDKIVLIYDGTHWCELCRSNNA